MKRFFISLSFLAVSLIISAVPAKKGIWKTVRLADGTEVRVELKGDEFGHYWQAADGTGYTKTAGTDTYERADIAKLGAQAMERRQQRNAARMKARGTDGPMKAVIGGEHTPYIGTKKGIIILVQFADTKFADGHDKALYNRIANEEGFTSSDGFRGSVKDYFHAQSNGLFNLDFDVVGPYTMPQGYAYYGMNGSSGNIDVNIRTMISEACRQADMDANFADYDWDGDGFVDQVFVLYAGRGEADGGNENTIWPHESQLYYPLTLDGVKVSTYACSNELRSDTEINGLGTICHEFSHCMGLPDFYDTQYGGNFGMGPWDLMSSGSYLDNSFCPAGYTSYERMYCGWKQPTVITKDTVITGMKGLSEDGETFIMYNDAHKDEYYLFENRTNTGWDSALYGSGMLVTHVDFRSYLWSSNIVNVTTNEFLNDHQRCTIIHADNKDGASSSTDLAGDPFPYGSVNAITKTTIPGTMLYNANTDGSYFMDKSILNITKADDGSISFDVKSNSAIETEKPEGALFYESFNICSAQGGNDGQWSGTGIGSGAFVPDNLGWTSANKFGGDKCARFGSNVQNGNVTTPEFEIDGETELTFKAAAWPGDGTALVLSVTSGDATLSTASFKLEQGQWGEYSTTINGKGKVKITFKAARRRFYLDEILAKPADNTGIGCVKTTTADGKEGKIYTIDGRFAGTDMESLGKGIYIVNGRKVVK